MPRLSRSFYNRPTLIVARELLGKYFVAGSCVGKIIETEAYIARCDPACHGFRGKTKRNAVLFGKPGLLYVYFTYGMHYCLNAVTEEEHAGAAVLIRAVDPVAGIALMKRRRGVTNATTPNPSLITRRGFTDGPAKVCQAFGIGRSHNGIDLVTDKKMWIENRGTKINPRHVKRTERIGISETKEKKWRFVLV